MEIITLVDLAIILFCLGALIFTLKVKMERKQIERELKRLGE